MFPSGHIGGALLVSVPFIIKLEPRRGVLFAAFAVLGGRVPDMDTVLAIPHHGITHTLVFTVASSIALAITAALIVEKYAPAGVVADSIGLSSRDLLVVALGALFVGQVSHLVLDMLSVGTAVTEPAPLHPLWPLWSRRVAWEVIPVRSDYTNFGLLAVGTFVSNVAYVVTHRSFVLQKVS